MAQVGYGTLTQKALMGVVHQNMSYVLMLSTNSHSPSWACNAELYLFTVVRNFTHSNPRPDKATQMWFPKKTSHP